MITISHDKQSGEVVIRTPHGMILINECTTPCMTRIVALPSQNGYVSTSDNPSIMAMWAGVPIAAEPLTDKDDTQECKAAVYDDLDVGE